MRKVWRSFKYNRYRLVSTLLSTVYPSICPVCSKPSDDVRYAPICMGCWEGIERYRGPSCRVCAAPLVSEHSGMCGECLSHTPPFSHVLSFGLYSGSLREAIHLLKFSGLRRLAAPLGRFLYELPVPEVDGIVPVPLSKKSLRERGFNQTLLLSRFLSRHLKIPLYMDVLYKKRDTAPQIGLRAMERAVNLKDAFGARGDLTGMRLLLLDDVMTTGATVSECSKTLIKAGAEKVVVATLARSAVD